jgi:SAM-dependent methyltransferase
MKISVKTGPFGVRFRSTVTSSLEKLAVHGGMRVRPDQDRMLVCEATSTADACPNDGGVRTKAPPAAWSEAHVGDSVEMPQDWDDAAGWERYYSGHSGDRAAESRRNHGSVGVRQVAGLIAELRSNGRTAVWFPGCGLSPLPRTVATFGFAVSATDVSESAVRFQQGPDGNEEVQRLVRQVVELGQSLPADPGTFSAAVLDFRNSHFNASFDLVINQRAFQGFPRPSMEKVAASHCIALKPGGRAIFDTINVQGERRDELEECLVEAGFYVPFYEANRRLRRELAATGIPHVFILGRPMIVRTGAYMDDAKRQADTDVLRRIFSEHESRLEAQYTKEQERVTADTKIAFVIYSTG